MNFENLKNLKKEAAGLKYSIEHAKPELVADYYKDYRSGKGIPKSLVGFAFDEKSILCRERQLEAKLKQIEALIDKVEREIEQLSDPEIRAIVRLYYVDELTQDEIADILHYNKATISRKLKHFKKLQQMQQNNVL